MGVVVRSNSMLCHEAGSPYNLNIQIPIYTKLLTHVEGVALSVHQYCVISIAPPTGHRESDTGSQTNII